MPQPGTGSGVQLVLVADTEGDTALHGHNCIQTLLAVDCVVLGKSGVCDPVNGTKLWLQRS